MKRSETRGYVFVFLGLLALLALTVWAAQFSLGSWGIVVTLAIAGAKAALVVTFFMQLRHSSGLVIVFALGGFFWLGILFLLTFADLLTRGAI